MTQYPFEIILKRLKLGAKVHRQEWRDNNDGCWIQLSDDERGIDLHFPDGSYNRYHKLCVSEDMENDILATDWIDPEE